MAKLYFNYSSMNAGKSTMLLQSNHNYLERGMKPQIYTSDLDNRYGSGEIVSRIGLKAKSNTFNTKTNIYKDILNKNNNDL
ncbi:thymidine kinase, partial [Gammaproteobacteria bacterium]|nr:thymidine kinase [Gammaproteobacteria bacterium]